MHYYKNPGFINFWQKQKVTHVWRRTLQNFFLEFIDKLLGHFLSFLSLKTLKIKIWKIKKLLEISSFYTYAPKITTIWCTVPEIRSAADKNICYFGPFLAYLPFPQWSRISVFNKRKWKKCLEILSFCTYMCNINEDHMIHCSWNIRCNRQKVSTFWTIFFPFSFSLLATWKIKILTLKETSWDIIIYTITS